MYKDSQNKEKWQKAADIFRALSHPVRLQILHQLYEDTKCVLEVQQILDIPQPNLSHHLAILKNVGLVDSQCRGSLRCYFVRDIPLVGKICAICEKIVQEKNFSKNQEIKGFHGVNG